MWPYTLYDFGTLGWVANVAFALAFATYFLNMKKMARSKRERDRADKGLTMCLTWASFAIVAAFPTRGSLIGLPIIGLKAMQGLV